MPSTLSAAPVVIVGGGLAGLSCAAYLQASKIDYLLLEASDAVGGRVRTDAVEGFLLDRGFQVFQTAYPEAQRLLDYEALDLRPLEPGALIFKSGKWTRMSDPWRRPRHAWQTMFNSVGTFGDRLKLLKLWRHVSGGPSEQLLHRPHDCTTRELLCERYRFSPDFIDSFLRPWLSGIFLEQELNTSANFFRFVFRMLADGDISYPAQGIQAIPDQLAARLEPSKIRGFQPVERVDGRAVHLASGEFIEGSAVVIATEVEQACRLLEGRLPERRHTATSCLYFAAEQAPVAEPLLMLNGAGEGPVNHVFVHSQASPRVAPDQQALLSVSLVGSATAAADDLSSIRQQLAGWFGSQAQSWRLLKRYDLPRALPAQPPGFNAEPANALELPAGIHVCGDHCESASVNGALRSGRLTAERIVHEMLADEVKRVDLDQETE